MKRRPLTPVQNETMVFCQRQVDEARKQNIDIKKVKKRDYREAERILEAQKGIVYTQGGNCTIRTLKVLERYGLIEILMDNSGVGTGVGAFPSKVKILNY